MAEGPVAALSEHAGGDFGSTDRRRGPLRFVKPGGSACPLTLEPRACSLDRISIELLLNTFPLSQINGINRRSY